MCVCVHVCVHMHSKCASNPYQLQGLGWVELANVHNKPDIQMSTVNVLIIISSFMLNLPNETVR